MWTVVTRGQNDASLGRLDDLLSLVVAKTVQAVDAIGDIWNTIALKQQLWHHLSTMQRVTGCLCQHNRVGNTGLKDKMKIMLISVVCRTVMWAVNTTYTKSHHNLDAGIISLYHITLVNYTDHCVQKKKRHTTASEQLHRSCNRHYYYRISHHQEPLTSEVMPICVKI